MAKKINYADMFTLRSDGRYQGYWRELDKDNKPTGKRHAICDKDPKALYEKIKDRESPKPLTFLDAAEAWKKSVWPKIAEGTRVCYAPAYTRAVELFGDRKMSDIQPWEIFNHLSYLQANDYSLSTIRVQKVIYRSVYRFAIVDKEMGREIRINPTDSVELPTGIKKQKKREAPESEIVDKIRSGANSYFGLYALFLISTGLRRGEALAVQWGDVDFEQKRISVTKQINYEGSIPELKITKTEAGVRQVPILPDLLPHLMAAKPDNAEDDDYIFHADDPKKYLTESMYRRRWLHYCKDMGFVTVVTKMRKGKNGRIYITNHYKPTLTAHNMRHGFATICFEADVDEYTTKEIIGHSKIETTRAIYTHLRSKKKNASIEKLEDYISEEIGGGVGDGSHGGEKAI